VDAVCTPRDDCADVAGAGALGHRAESELAAFRREVDLLSSLHHRNIVQVGAGAEGTGGRLLASSLLTALWAAGRGSSSGRCQSRQYCCGSLPGTAHLRFALPFLSPAVLRGLPRAWQSVFRD
jgi:hypothetical protein